MRFGSSWLLGLCFLVGCPGAGLDVEDADQDGFAVSDGDCHDNNPAINPAADENWYDGIDQDCDGADDFDQDGDGHAFADAEGYEGDFPLDDCNDLDATVFGGAADLVGNGVDESCDGVDGMDADGDGFASRGSGGDDCLDEPVGNIDAEPATVFPGAVDFWYDGVDQDCDDVDDFDQDGDGHASLDDVIAWEAATLSVYSGDLPIDDCVDAPEGEGGIVGASINPAAAETWYDGVDQNCDAEDDFDRDGDLFASEAQVAAFEATGGTYGGALPATDCEDAPEGRDGVLGALISPAATETWYDGLDQDCAGDDDFDQDGDGHASESEVAAFQAGGGSYVGLPADDCDDTDPAASPTAPEVWYDGVDQDCQGGNDFDADGDGFASADAVETFETNGGAYTGALPPTDCVDSPSGGDVFFPGANDAVGDDNDQNCDGIDGADEDGDGEASLASGGTDCVDSPAGDGGILGASIGTGQSEVWYDGVDQNCDGRDDFDRDGDGFASEEAVSLFESAGGSYDGLLDVADCDDLEPEVSPDASEICEDGIDNNCDSSPAPCAPTGGFAETVAYATIESSEREFGQSLLVAGDVNADGFTDLLVSDEFRTALVFGPVPAGVSEVDELDVAWLRFAPWLIENSVPMIVMDWNCDGDLDVVIGDSDAGQYGSVRAFLGPFSPGMSYNADISMDGRDVDEFGTAVGFLPDETGSQCGRLLVGSTFQPEGGIVALDPGEVSSGPRPADPDLTVRLGVRGSGFGIGRSIAVGQFAGDAHPDFILAAGNQFYVIDGTASGEVDLSADPSGVSSYNSGNWSFLARTLPDLDLDGRDDLVVVGGPHQGGAGVGGPILLADPASMSSRLFVLGSDTGRILRELNSVGDLDADGTTDFAATWVGVNTGGSTPGDVYVVYGPDYAAPTASSPRFRLQDGEDRPDFGYRVAGADFTGDGIDDLIIGSGRLDPGGRGKVFLFEGGRW